MRIETDSLGQLQIPDNAYYGINSFRAKQNFPISGTQIHPIMIKSYLLLKKAAAEANFMAKALAEDQKNAIVEAVDNLLKTNYEEHFIVDTFQAGAGTSQNMNTNEVIANKANELLGGKIGEYKFVNPNDHVNMSQSTNDSYPTAMQLATLTFSKNLTEELRALSKSLSAKAKEFDSVLKSGRTHLQDAVPIRLGQEFGAYKRTVDQLHDQVLFAQNYLRILGIGGSAVGTGINVPEGYREHILPKLQEYFDDDELGLSPNMCSSMQSQMPMMIYSNALKTIALELTRICNDLRLLSSGPNNGLQEIFLPATQAGSSIMPGKVNPSILEMSNQVFFKVLGNDHAMALAMQAGQLELNVMMPLMCHLALESTHIICNTLETLRGRCIDGIKPNFEQCERNVMNSSQIVTALNPIIGYAKAAELAKEAVNNKKSVIEVIREKKILSEEAIKKILDPRQLTGH
jgi:aspartate ammonia-lyase